MGISRKLRRNRQKNAFKIIRQTLNQDIQPDADYILDSIAMGEFSEDNFSDILNENFQQNIMESEIWEQMVNDFGEEKALELVAACQASLVSDSSNENMHPGKKE